MSVFYAESRFLARLGDPEIEEALTKGEIVDRFEGYNTVKALTITLSKLAKAGYITVIKTAFCPKCGEELDWEVNPTNHRIMLTDMGRVRAKVLWDTMKTMETLTLLEQPESAPEPAIGPTQETVNEALDEVAKDLDEEAEDVKVTPFKVQQKRVRPGQCPVCREGKLMQGACDKCGWDEADGIECPSGLVKPLEKTEVCAECPICEIDKDQPCAWTKWLPD